jgi:2'-5' RNA ligase
MYSILSLVDNPVDSEIQKILNAILPITNNNPPIIWQYPHFTWHSAGGFDSVLIDRELSILANRINRFSMRVTGIGVFTGITRILFLPILKTAELVDLQNMIYSSSQKIASDPSEFYTSEKWIPHITLLSSSEDQQYISPAIQELSKLKIDFEIEINNISFGQYTGNEAKIFLKHNLQ